jgi:hypothetical protein
MAKQQTRDASNRKKGEKRKNRNYLWMVREKIQSVATPKKKEVLFKKMLGVFQNFKKRMERESFKKNERKSGVLEREEKTGVFFKNEKMESDEECRNKEEGCRKIKKEQASPSRREREKNAYSSRETFKGITKKIFRLARRVCYKNKRNQEYLWENAELLQDRHCEQEKTNSNRSRWLFTWNFNKKKTRQKEGLFFETVRVESVESQEQGSNGESQSSGGQCLYDIEVAGNHNYFAEDILVSNCHLIKNRKARRSKNVLHLLKKTKDALFLSGTPILNRPVEIYNVFNYIKPTPFWGRDGFALRYCNPPEAPIWCGDFSFKKLGELKVGDEVIGWKKREKQVKKGGKKIIFSSVLCKTKITNIIKRRASIVKVYFESGRVIRCTPDHRWLNYCKYPGAKSGQYVAAEVGKKLCFVIEPSEKIKKEDRWLAGWLAGMFDGEGTAERVAQSLTHNKFLYGKIKNALIKFKLPYSEYKDGFYLIGGRQTYVNFLNKIKPFKVSERFENMILSGKFRNKDEVVKVVPDGEGEVISMTTGTGNYVAWGYASKNCEAKETRFGWDFNGASNLEELRRELSFMLRWRKEEVLDQLPDKTHNTLYTEMGNWTNYNQILNNYRAWLKENDLNQAAVYAEALTKVNYLKQEVAFQKLNQVHQILTEFLEADKNVLVFSQYKTLINELALSYQDKAVVLTGDTPDKERPQLVDKFQDDPNCRIFFSTIKAGGVGLTLTKADTVVFTDLDWTPAMHQQAEDRAWRYGQKNNVNVYYLIAPQTIEEEIWDRLNLKQGIVDKLVESKQVDIKDLLKNI